MYCRNKIPREKKKIILQQSVGNVIQILREKHKEILVER